MTPDQNGIFLTKKQASVTATTLVVLGLLLFVAGYFWGKQSVIDGFTQKTSQESFNDQVDCLLTMQSFAAKNGNPLIQDNQAEETPSVSTPINPEISNKSESFEKQFVEEPKAETSEIKKEEPSQDSHVKAGKHFAALAGFAKKSLAEQMVARLKKRNIDVLIKVKTGRSASGKTQKTWYQVVTRSYDSIESVQDLVKKILKSEKIKRSDIKIV